MKYLKIYLSSFILMISACSEELEIPFAPDLPPVQSLEPGIPDIKIFLNSCPETDSNLEDILRDFEIFLNGHPVTDFSCSAPISSMDNESYGMPLIILQSLRVIKRMNTGPLPWTEESLYDWMKNTIGGINIIDNISSGGFCCQTFGDKNFIAVKNLDLQNRMFKKKWIGISSTIDLLVHEVRHLTGPGHTSCCGIDGGFDLEYNLNNISSFGTQLWLNEKWRDKEIDMGLSSFNDEELREYDQWYNSTVSGFRLRFCN